MWAPAFGYHRRPMRGFLTVPSLVVVLGLGLGLGGCGGCNDNNNPGRLPDAPPASDASPPDAVDPSAVTLTIIKDGSPAIGVTVYFLNADDSVVATAVTDVMGRALAVMAAGGSVTAVNPFTTPPPPAAVAVPDELRTFVGVKPGDRLVLSHDTNGVAFTLLASPVTNAQNYQVATTCGGGTISPGGGSGGSGSPDPGGSIMLPHCDSAADIAIVALDAQNTPLSGLYHPDAALTSTVDLSADAYDTLTDIAFMYMNLPDTSVSAQLWLTVGRGNLGPFPVNLNTSTSSVPHAPAASATSLIVETTLPPSGGGIGEHDVLDWKPAETSYTLDVMGQLLPDLTGPPSFDVATRKVTWTEASQGAAPDLTTTAISVTRDRQWHWEIVAPYKQGELRFPHLPADVYDWNPAASDDVTAEQVMNAKLPGGYDAVRAHILDIRDLSLDSSPAPGAGQPDLSAFVNGNTGRVVLVQSRR